MDLFNSGPKYSEYMRYARHVSEHTLYYEY